MPNTYVNKVVQSNGTTLIDISDTTAVASDVASGKYFYLATGEKVVGTSSGGGSISVTDVSNTYGTTAEVTGSGISITDVSNASGTTAEITGGGSATAHSIYLEFSDSTNTTIPVYYDDSYVGTIITSYAPDTYSSKQVVLAKLDGVTWYEYSAIPIGVELIDYLAVTEDHAINSSGEVIAEQWYSVSDYTPIEPGMTFSYCGCRWYYLGFYDSSKEPISTIYIYNDTTESPYNSNIGDGTLSANEIPSNAAYVRITSINNVDAHRLSLIRTS